MSKLETMIKVEYDLQHGDLGKARDRLHGLMLAYPDDLALRVKLAEIYWDLQQPAMAGRYWYLVENKTPEMVRAIEAFEKKEGNRPLQIARALNFSGDIEQIEGTYPALKIAELMAVVKEKHSEDVLLGLPGMPPKPKRLNMRHGGPGTGFGCWVAFIFVSCLILIGLITVVGWIF